METHANETAPTLANAGTPTWMTPSLTAMVRGIAGAIARRLPPAAALQYDDLFSIGLLALVEAQPRYDESHGVDFNGFARRRVIGAMLDELRNCDTVSRRRRMAIRRGLESDAALPCPRLVTMEDASSVPCPGPDPEEAASQQQKIDRLVAAEARLPPRLRTVLALRLRNDWTLREIGDHLGVTQARVCQLVGEGVDRLREDMDVEGVSRLAA